MLVGDVILIVCTRVNTISANRSAAKIALSMVPVGVTNPSAETFDLRTLVGHAREDLWIKIQEPS